jgi:hypothetical protein
VQSALKRTRSVDLQDLDLTTQGMSLQGTNLQGMSLQGMSLQGMSLQGMSLQGMSLQGTSLQGMTLQGMTLQGTSLQGAVLTAIDGNGVAITLRIAAAQIDPHDPDGEITLYALEVQTATGEWQNVCNPDASGERWAVPVSGSWDARGGRIYDPTVITFGCTSGVIVKCMRWGYKPWKTVNGQSLAPYHQACTRMARADYCGKGVSHTVDGTLIDIYDTLGIQVRTSKEELKAAKLKLTFEAAWTPDGAYCVAKERYYGKDVNDLIEGERIRKECPERFVPLTQEDKLAEDKCHVRLQDVPRSAILISNQSQHLNVNTLD